MGDQPAEEGQFDGHGFMVNVLVGVIVFIFGLMVMLVICINNTCIKRYLKARQLMIKAAQYRPSKYKKVSPSTAASITAISSIYQMQECSQTVGQTTEDQFKEI